MILRLIPLVIASLLLAAHFLRGGNIGLMLVSVLVPLLLLIRKRWSLILVQLLAYAAAAVWLFTAIHLVQERMISARPWSSAAIILGSVALFSLFAGILLNSPTVKAKYPSS
jgi:hypothetical protein